MTAPDLAPAADLHGRMADSSAAGFARATDVSRTASATTLRDEFQRRAATGASP